MLVIKLVRYTIPNSMRFGISNDPTSPRLILGSITLELIRGIKIVTNIIARVSIYNPWRKIVTHVLDVNQILCRMGMEMGMEIRCESRMKMILMYINHSQMGCINSVPNSVPKMPRSAS